MTNNNRYFLSEGCCICGTKHSTSQFRPWFEHYPEETFCRVFKMQSLQGRRGHLCNPCVLFIKRTVQSMDNSTLNSDPRKRLDMKLKTSRLKVPDIFPPGSSQHPRSNQAPKVLGYFARNMRLTPKYVYTGKAYIKLKSKNQLIPAGEWQDPRNFLEDEYNAYLDLKHYRRITLKKGRKTLQQKDREKREAEARENREIFGNPEDDDVSSEEEDAENPSSGSQAIVESNKINVIKHTNHQSNPPKIRTYGTRANVLKGKVAIERKSQSQFSEEDENTDTSDELIDGEENRSASSDDAEPSAASSGAKRAHEDSEGEDLVSSPTAQNGDSFGIKRRKVESSTWKKNRRVIRTPVRNFKRPRVSFMDCSYWQKFPLCCMTVYVGEGGHCVMRPHENMTLATCPFAMKKSQQLRKASTTKAQKASFSDTPSSSCSNTRIASPDDTRIASPNDTWSASPNDTRIASPNDTRSASPNDTRSASPSDTQSISSLDSFEDIMKMGEEFESDGVSSVSGDLGGSGSKDGGADQESVMSSGEEELNDNRASCTSSPLIEKPCKFFPQ
ncbi:hypothetical protein ACOMHN_047785 [Nucella lapillus]